MIFLLEKKEPFFSVLSSHRRISVSSPLTCALLSRFLNLTPMGQGLPPPWSDARLLLKVYSIEAYTTSDERPEVQLSLRTGNDT
jgi:hypothetical protein